MIKPDDTKILYNKGMTYDGNLYIKFKVNFPDKIFRISDLGSKFPYKDFHKEVSQSAKTNVFAQNA